MTAAVANWANLHPDLLIEIVRRLTLYEDFVAFGSVCSSWRYVSLQEKSRFISTLIPWLMLPPEKGTHLRSFFSVSEDASRQFILPEAGGKKCFSSRGWLITIAKNLRISLLHPFSRVQIKLPHLKTMDNWVLDYLNISVPYANFISKSILSLSPSRSSHYIVMVIYGSLGKLAYAKPGDNSWTTIDTWNGVYLDITYYKGRFYAVNGSGQIVACNIGGDDSTMAQTVAQLPYDLVSNWPEYFYIVESAGALLVVTRGGDLRFDEETRKCTYGTYEIKVFEVDLEDNTWTELKDLGNRTLFVGNNSSFSIEACNCKPNCIYFTDDCTDPWYKSNGGEGKDMGIFNILDGTIKPHFRGSSCHRINPPIWVEQSF